MDLVNKVKENKTLYFILKNVIYTIAFIAFFLLCYLIINKSIKNEYLFPSIGNVFKEAFNLLKTSGFWKAYFSTIIRVIFAFLISFLLALIFSILSYKFKVISKIIDPLISIFKSLPTMAILLIILVYSNPQDAPIIVAYIALFPLLYTSFNASFNMVDKNLIEMSGVYKVPLKKQILSLYIPSMAPYAIKEGASNLAFTLKLVVSAEIMANTYISIGGLMQDAKVYFEMAKLFALTILIVILGIIVEACGNLISNNLIKKSGGKSL